jgi:hypothetical protein
VADLAQLERALINADAAGDTAAAQTLAGEIRRMRGAGTAPKQPQAAPIKIGADAFPDALRETLRGTDWGTRNIAGAGTALANLYEGGKQLFGFGDPKAIEAQRIIADEAPVGAIAGNIATYAPLALVPGANTVIGGALAGAGTGALQPTMDGESRLSNAAVGGIVGGAVPAAIRAGKTAKAALIDPFTDAGRTRIAGGVINRTAADPQAAAAKMLAARGATPGFSPTAAQGADDAGVAALERATRAANPGAFDDVEKSQRAALADAVRGIAGDDVARTAAVTARESAVNPLYDAAKKATVQGDETFDSLLRRPTISSGVGQAAEIAADEGRRFQLTPAIKGATQYLDEAGNAIAVPPMPKPPSDLRNLVSEVIESGGISRSELADMGLDATIKARPGLFRKEGKTADDLVEWMVDRGWLSEAQVNYANANSTGGSHDLARRFLRESMDTGQVFHPAQDDLAYQFGDQLGKWGAQYGDLTKRTLPSTPATYSGQTLHDIKMGIDKAITDGSQGIGNRVAGSQLTAKDAYLQWLESKIPEYGQARQTYADMSRPINQMDIGQEFAKRLIPGLYRDMPAPAQLNAQAFARALTDQGDDIARGATGMKGAKLDSVMEPQQMQALRGVSSDLQMMKAAENAGRGVGSDTVQKTAMSHIAAQAGIPNWMADVARVPGGWMKQAGGLLYGRSDDQVRQIMAEMLKNPQQAAQAMQAAGVNPSVMAELLSKGAQGAALSAVPAYANSR